MSDIGSDRETQIEEQNTKVKTSILGSFSSFPDWIKLGVKVCLGFWLFNFLIGITPIEERGLFGDSFGAVNSLFSALALLGVAWGISLQREELKIARGDREDTQKLVRDQKDNLTLQRFEGAFFQLLTNLNIFVEQIELKIALDSEAAMTQNAMKLHFEKDKTHYKGKPAFDIIMLQLRHFYRAESAASRQRAGTEYAPDMAFVARIIYYRFITTHSQDIERYLASVAYVLLFIANSEINEEKKTFYFDLIKSQLSKGEATLLAIDYATSNMRDDVRVIVEKYGLAQAASWGHPILTDTGMINHKIFGNSIRP